MKHLLFGLLLGLVAAFPHLAGQGAAPAESCARWLLAQPAVWGLAAGLLARRRIAHHLFRRIP